MNAIEHLENIESQVEAKAKYVLRYLTGISVEWQGKGLSTLISAEG